MWYKHWRIRSPYSQYGSKTVKHIAAQRWPTSAMVTFLQFCFDERAKSTIVYLESWLIWRKASQQLVLRWRRPCSDWSALARRAIGWIQRLACRFLACSQKSEWESLFASRNLGEGDAVSPPFAFMYIVGKRKIAICETTTAPRSRYWLRGRCHQICGAVTVCSAFHVFFSTWHFSFLFQIKEINGIKSHHSPSILTCPSCWDSQPARAPLTSLQTQASLYLFRETLAVHFASTTHQNLPRTSPSVKLRLQRILGDKSIRTT